MQKISTMLWFDHQAEEAAQFYVSVFRNGTITGTTRYSDESAKASGRPLGSVMTVAFEIAGREFIAMNAGPAFKFNESVSFVVACADQAEIDYFWDAFTAGGGAPSRCGWLKDRYGLSWQIMPSNLPELMKNNAAVGALMRMTKIVIAELEAAR